MLHLHLSAIADNLAAALIVELIRQLISRTRR